MVDPERIRRRLAELDRRLVRLRAADRERARRDPDAMAAVERHLQIAIQAAIDVAAHLVAQQHGATPETYADAFTALVRGDVIDEALASVLRRAAGLRNVLVHAYVTVDPERVLAHLGHLDALEAFARAVVAHLEET